MEYIDRMSACEVRSQAIPIAGLYATDAKTHKNIDGVQTDHVSACVMCSVALKRHSVCMIVDSTLDAGFVS